MELVKDYDCTIHYHPGKANIIANALSRKGYLEALPTRQKYLIKKFEKLSLEVVNPLSITNGAIAVLIVRPEQRDRI